MAGKGDTPRPVNRDNWDKNYTHIFDKENCDCEECKVSPSTN